MVSKLLGEFLAAQALSFDRLEILHGPQFETAIVFPRDKQQFVSLLKSIHPQIEVENHIMND
ncbi:PH domain-containing protein [Bacillus sp. 95MFCvi2.1]|uniref:PH domain-containing protein n=1 Tax=Bacillus sp. 95MFCvi2.1 TaxID=1151121 RepID=UPI002F2B7C27